MEVSSQQGAGSQPQARPSRLAIPPMLGPGSLRISILTHVKQYRALFDDLKDRRETSDEDVSLDGLSIAPVFTHQDAAEKFSAVHRDSRFKVLQNALLEDITGLSLAAQSLEKQLLSRRPMNWIANCAFVAITQVVYIRAIPSIVNFLVRTRIQAASLVWAQYRPFSFHETGRPMLWILQWFLYPIAIYQISLNERRITEAATFKNDVAQLLDDVNKGRELREESIACLSEERWNKIPWDILERH